MERHLDKTNKENITNIIYQEIKCSQYIAKIITSYYLLISLEFKSDLDNIMKDRSDRKLKYKIPKYPYPMQYANNTFAVEFVVHGRNLSIDFFTGLDVEHERPFERVGDIYNTRIQSFDFIGWKFIKKPPRKSFNRLTREEFLALE